MENLKENVSEFTGFLYLSLHNSISFNHGYRSIKILRAHNESYGMDVEKTKILDNFPSSVASEATTEFKRHWSSKEVHHSVTRPVSECVRAFRNKISRRNKSFNKRTSKFTRLLPMLFH